MWNGNIVHGMNVCRMLHAIVAENPAVQLSSWSLAWFMVSLEALNMQPDVAAPALVAALEALRLPLHSAVHTHSLWAATWSIDLGGPVATNGSVGWRILNSFRSGVSSFAE